MSTMSILFTVPFVTNMRDVAASYAEISAPARPEPLTQRPRKWSPRSFEEPAPAMPDGGTVAAAATRRADKVMRDLILRDFTHGNIGNEGDAQ